MGTPANNTSPIDDPNKPNPDGVLSTLSESQKNTFDLLQRVLGGDADEEGSISSMFEGLTRVLQDFRESISEEVPGSQVLGGTAAGAGLLSGASGALPSKAITVNPTLHPTAEMVSKLPVEFSLGYLLLYDQLVKMGELSGQKKEEKKGGGIGSFFSGLLKGAEGIALIAVGLIAFAGALFLFQFIQWDPAMKGLVAFSLFVVGMTLIAKLLGNNLKDFKTFAEGVLLMTAGIVLFNVAIWISAKIIPYWPAAKQTIEAYGIFVLGMVAVARILGKELGNFLKFAEGVLLMTAGIILFDAAIFITSLILPFIPDAMKGLILFGEFTLGAVVLSKLLGKNMTGFVEMAAAILVLDIALMLFGLAMFEFAKLLPLMPDAENTLLQSVLILGLVATVSLVAQELVEPIAAFVILLAGLSIAFILWGIAIGIMGALNPIIPAAIEGITSTLGLLGLIALISIPIALVSPAIALFAIAITAVSVAFITWGAALFVMGSVSSKIPAATKGIQDTLGVLGLLALMSIPVALVSPAIVIFSAALIPLSAAFIAWGLALGVMGTVSPKIPGALQGIKDSMGVLAQIGLMSIAATLLIAPVIAFSASLLVISVGLSAFAGVLQQFAGLGNSINDARSSISKILDTFKMISQSMNDETAKDIKAFSAALNSLSWASAAGFSGLAGISDALSKIAQADLTNTFKPLTALIDKQSEIDKLAASFERISKAIRPPKETIWDSLANLTGGVKAGTTSSMSGAEPKKDFGPTPTEQYLKNISERLADWDAKINTIAINSAEAGGGSGTITVTSSPVTGGGSLYAVNGPLQL